MPLLVLQMMNSMEMRIGVASTEQPIQNKVKKDMVCQLKDAMERMAMGLGVVDQR